MLGASLSQVGNGLVVLLRLGQLALALRQLLIDGLLGGIGDVLGQCGLILGLIVVEVL
jgi:hypothetical protein